MSPIEYHAITLNQALSAKQYGADFFRDGGHPTHVIQSDTEPTSEQAATLKEKLFAASRRREPVVLPKSVTLTALQVKPEESQFLDTQRLGSEQIARIFGVMPEMIGASQSGASLTYANREQKAADFLAYGLLFWVRKME